MMKVVLSFYILGLGFVAAFGIPAYRKKISSIVIGASLFAVCLFFSMYIALGDPGNWFYVFLEERRTYRVRGDMIYTDSWRPVAKIVSVPEGWWDGIISQTNGVLRRGQSVRVSKISGSPAWGNLTYDLHVWSRNSGIVVELSDD